MHLPKTCKSVFQEHLEFLSYTVISITSIDFTQAAAQRALYRCKDKQRFNSVLTTARKSATTEAFSRDPKPGMVMGEYNNRKVRRLQCPRGGVGVGLLRADSLSDCLGEHT